MTAKQVWIACAIWTTISLLLTLPRLTHPAFGIQGDLPIHYHITRSFAQSFNEGDPLPRWAGLLDGGRGNAFFTFYPPLPYLLSSILIKLLRVDLLGSLKISTFIYFIIAQLGAFCLAREFFNFRRSMLASLLYVWLPAFSLITLHRAFFANALGISLVPFALLGAHLLLTNKRLQRGLIFFGLGFSAIILTHAITTYLTGIAIALMTFVYLIRYDCDQVRVRGIFRLCAGGVLVSLLTVFFLLPQKIEMDWVQLNLTVIQQDYRNYFLFAKSSDGSRYRRAWADVNYVTSLITIIQTLMPLLFGLVGWKMFRVNRVNGPVDQRQQAIVWFAAVIVIFGFFISLPVSDLIWRRLPGLKFIQFPWRFQPFVSLASGLLGAIALEEWKSINRLRRTIIAAFLTWVVIAGSVFTFALANLKEPGITRAEVYDWLNSTTAKTISIDEGRIMQNEDDLKYLPYSSNQLYFRPAGSDYNLYPPAARPGGIEFISGRGAVKTEKLKMSTREFTLENDGPVSIRIITYYYPNWIARIDGRAIAIKREEQTGLMTVEIPSGTHRLTLSFEIWHPVERAARIISTAAWLLFLGWIIWRCGRFVIDLRS